MPGVGQIIKLINRGGEIQLIPKGEVAINNRRKEKIFEISQISNAVITERKTCTSVPGDVDAVISTFNGTVKWIHCKKLDVTESEMSSNPQNVVERIRLSWTNQFYYRKEIRDESGNIVSPGLRLPQVGALHSISAHLGINSDIANIVMPTGTGKTETMLSTLMSEQYKCLLVVVPSKALRDQTAEKFANLGILKQLGCLGDQAEYPVVGVLKKRPRSVDDLEIFSQCNVIVAVINTIAQGTAAALSDQIASRCSHLIIDEAHHVAASTWEEFRAAFKGKPILQFTATPYREDKSPILGKIVYNYPLQRAQEDGLFSPIDFKGVFETDVDAADRAIAVKALEQLNADIDSGLDHVLMARCKTQTRAEVMLGLYQELAAEHNPVMIVSGSQNLAEEGIRKIKNSESRIVVCVNMLSEGFDLPELKVAAMHDKFKSLAITLQFVGRFTRVSEKNLGNATIIANTGLDEVADSIQSLYDEDPDWDKLVASISFEKVEEERRLLEFLQNADQIHVSEEDIVQLTPQSLTPKFNTVIYKTTKFHPTNFHEGLESGHSVIGNECYS